MSRRSSKQHRSQVFDGSNLAYARLMLGDIEGAVANGERVLDHAAQVRSARLAPRLTPLYLETARRGEDNSDVWQLSRELGQRIDTARLPA